MSKERRRYRCASIVRFVVSKDNESYIQYSSRRSDWTQWRGRSVGLKRQISRRQSVSANDKGNSIRMHERHGKLRERERGARETRPPTKFI